MLKDLKEKREGLVTKLKELVKSNASEDPMGKIKQSIAEMEEVSENPVSDLVEVCCPLFARSPECKEKQRYVAFPSRAGWYSFKG